MGGKSAQLAADENDVFNEKSKAQENVLSSPERTEPTIIKQDLQHENELANLKALTEHARAIALPMVHYCMIQSMTAKPKLPFNISRPFIDRQSSVYQYGGPVMRLTFQYADNDKFCIDVMHCADCSSCKLTDATDPRSQGFLYDPYVGKILLSEAMAPFFPDTHDVPNSPYAIICNSSYLDTTTRGYVHCCFLEVKDTGGGPFLCFDPFDGEPAYGESDGDELEDRFNGVIKGLEAQSRRGPYGVQFRFRVAKIIVKVAICDWRECRVCSDDVVVEEDPQEPVGKHRYGALEEYLRRR